MRAIFTQSFKIQAVEKVLERANGITVKEIADNLGVEHSTLSNWIALARQQKLEPRQDNEVPRMTKEERPQDWSTEEKLNMVIACASLTEDNISELCREKGVFPHYIKQWKQDFVNGQAVSNKNITRSDNKTLRQGKSLFLKSCLRLRV